MIAVPLLSMKVQAAPAAPSTSMCTWNVYMRMTSMRSRLVSSGSFLTCEAVKCSRSLTVFSNVSFDVRPRRRTLATAWSNFALLLSRQRLSVCWMTCSDNGA